MSRAGISADIAEMCLGHALGGMRRNVRSLRVSRRKTRRLSNGWRCKSNALCVRQLTLTLWCRSAPNPGGASDESGGGRTFEDAGLRTSRRTYRLPEEVGAPENRVWLSEREYKIVESIDPLPPMTGGGFEAPRA